MRYRAGMRTLLAALFLALLTACGGSSAVGEKAEPTAPAVTAPTLWSKNEAGKQFLKMAAPANKAIDEVNLASQKPGADHTNVGPQCEKAIPAFDKFMRDLTTGSWPTNVAADIKTLIAEVAKERAGLLVCSKATSFDEVNAGIQIILDAASNGTSQLVRVGLGLPGTK